MFVANAFEANSFLVTELLVSSVLALVAVFLFISCASAFSFNQSLKSRRLGYTQCFLTVKSEHDFFILGGSFCMAVLRNAALFKSESFDSDLNTPTRLVGVFKNAHRIVNDFIAIVLLQWWKTVEFIQMCTYDRLWLAKSTF